MLSIRVQGVRSPIRPKTPIERLFDGWTHSWAKILYDWGPLAEVHALVVVYGAEVLEGRK